MDVNLTTLANTTSWIGMTQQVNTYSSGILGYGLILIVSLVSFGALYKVDGFKSAMIGSSWISVMFCVALTVMEIISPLVMFVSIVVAVISTISTYFYD